MPEELKAQRVKQQFRAWHKENANPMASEIKDLRVVKDQGRTFVIELAYGQGIVSEVEVFGVTVVEVDTVNGEFDNSWNWDVDEPFNSREAADHYVEDLIDQGPLKMAELAEEEE